MNKIKILVLSLVAIIVVLLLIIVSLLSYQLGVKKGDKQSSGAGQDQKLMTNSFPSTSDSIDSSKVFISDKDKIPQTITGTIDFIDDSKVVIRQFSNLDLSYEISKDEVTSITAMKKNPNFDQAKADKLKQAKEDELKAQGLDPSKMPIVSPIAANSNQNISQKQPELSDEDKKLMNDPTLRMFVEEKIDWNQMEKESQVHVTKDKDGKEKISVFPKDFSIGPPVGTQSQ